MKVKGIEGLTMAQIQDEIACGARFVQFPWCVSLVVVSLRQSSPIYFIKNGESAFWKALPFTLISFVFGWWGLPFGIYYTLICLFTNFSGGTDKTSTMVRTLQQKTGGHVFEFEATQKLAFIN